MQWARAGDFDGAGHALIGCSPGPRPGRLGERPNSSTIEEYGEQLAAAVASQVRPATAYERRSPGAAIEERLEPASALDAPSHWDLAVWAGGCAVGISTGSSAVANGATCSSRAPDQERTCRCARTRRSGGGPRT